MEQAMRTGAAKARALFRLYLHSRKLRALARELADALAESREVSSWPGDRLQVGAAVSEHVEKLTRRLHIEAEAHGRLAAPGKVTCSAAAMRPPNIRSAAPH